MPAAMTARLPTTHQIFSPIFSKNIWNVTSSSTPPNPPLTKNAMSPAATRTSAMPAKSSCAQLARAFLFVLPLFPPLLEQPVLPEKKCPADKLQGAQSYFFGFRFPTNALTVSGSKGTFSARRRPPAVKIFCWHNYCTNIVFCQIGTHRVKVITEPLFFTIMLKETEI